MTMVAILLLFVTSAMGQEGKNSLGHGYRGFIEIEEMEDFAAINLSTTHGYQFNPNIFVGLGVDYFSIIGGTAWLKHADFRYDKTFKGKYNLRRTRSVRSASSRPLHADARANYRR